jgi:uncharacterized protein YycO
VALYAGKRLHAAHKRLETGHSDKPVPTPTPRPGDILLFHNARGLNRLITLFTNSPFYHAGIYAGHNQVIEAQMPGVQRNDLGDRERDYVVVPASEGYGRAALAWAETQIGDGYDKLDIGIIILDRIFRFLHFNYTSGDRFSCGEFVAVAFDKAGVRLIPDRDLDDVVPGDFARVLLPAEQIRRIR